MPCRQPSVPILLVPTAATAILACSFAHSQDLDRMVVWHDEVFNSLHPLYMQEARQYALRTVLTAAASAALFRTLREGRASDWVLYAILAALGLYARLLFVLVPDAIQGGSRFLHRRHALPGFLAMQIANAHVLSMGWRAPTSAVRIGSRAGFFLVLGLGIGSCWLIPQAESWWNKNFSAGNREVAALVNATDRPLLWVTDSGVGLGKAISLAYDLDEKVIVKVESRSSDGVSTTGFSDIVLLTPSAELGAQLSAAYGLVVPPDIGQSYRAAPESMGTGE